MRRLVSQLIVSIAVLVLVAGGSAAAAASGDSITIYGGGMGFVRTHLDRILEPGDATVRLEGLPSSFDATSLVVLNDQVELLGTHGLRTYQDVAAQGASLALDLRVDEAVRGLDIAYLTGGLGWSASYSLRVDPDDRTARLSGFARIANQSGADLDRAEIQLLAGQVRRGRGATYSYDAAVEMGVARKVAAAPAPQMTQAGFAGYHLYTLAEPLSLAAGESRRVRLFPEARLSVERELRLVSDVNGSSRQIDPERRAVTVRYRVTRPQGTEMGDVPLPQGQVQILQPDAEGRAQLLGIASIPDSPAGQELVLPVGTAFDIVAERQQTDFTRVSREVRTSAWRITLRNASDRDETVEVIERVPGDWEILSASQEPTEITARTARFQLQVLAGGSAELTYEVRVKS